MAQKARRVRATSYDGGTAYALHVLWSVAQESPSDDPTYHARLAEAASSAMHGVNYGREEPLSELVLDYGHKGTLSLRCDQGVWHVERLVGPMYGEGASEGEGGKGEGGDRLIVQLEDRKSGFRGRFAELDVRLKRVDRAARRVRDA